jgi:hypothetical protein
MSRVLVIGDAIWKRVPGWPTLEASNKGQVRNTSCWGTNELSQHKNKRGYYEVWPRISGRRFRFRVHTLVLLAFYGPSDISDAVCRHLDGNALNNEIANLVWGTMSENNEDKRLHGTDNSGERCAASKLTAQQVRQIIYATRTKLFSGVEIAKWYGISQPTISEISNRRTWSHIWQGC